MSAQEKTEQPTAKKQRQSREKGQVAQSSTLTSTVILLGIGVLGAQTADAMGDRLRRMMHLSLEAAGQSKMGLEDRLLIAKEAFSDGVTIVFPLLLLTAILTIASSFVQVGALLTFEPLIPRLNKLNPVEGIKKKIFSTRTAIELGKSVLVIVVIGWAVFGTISGDLDTMVRLSSQEPLAISLFTGSLLVRCFFLATGIMAAIGLADLLFQRWQGMRDMRMTKQEVKQEHKDQEGDPLIRSARAQMQQEIAQQNTLQQARKADVLITNPDHLACALSFDPESEHAPRLIARGKNFLAEKIKEVAREEGIPITRDVSLAHALFDLEIDQSIPPELFDAVAVVLHWVATEARARGESTPWDHLLPAPDIAPPPTTGPGSSRGSDPATG